TNLVPGGCVPDLEVVIEAPGDQPPAIRTESHGREPVHVSAEAEPLVASSPIPDLQLSAEDVKRSGARSKELTVRAKGPPLHAACVPPEVMVTDVLTRRHIPDRQGLVLA